ncbi:uncharacterized protein LAESUDRAFT_811353 [Laetiporus sulphureus 93-53]|uniref:Uncharacterized protein n=1 Tax=Laetiporus sulphureus 93-53 TaxID=1314785 RepID=A0A165FCF2_9APHY|nr:uncharacterized protein LAESUDRAFT_811353 [Laetiporus sulphureus 93-53]KZT08758.1 hypothetical protein LAESUDRAFT_811353 [Laetiporus sulphureus 93-53]
MIPSPEVATYDNDPGKMSASVQAIANLKVADSEVIRKGDKEFVMCNFCWHLGAERECERPRCDLRHRRGKVVARTYIVGCGYNGTGHRFGSVEPSSRERATPKFLAAQWAGRESQQLCTAGYGWPPHGRVRAAVEGLSATDKAVATAYKACEEAG